MPRRPLPGFGVKGRLGSRGAMVRAFLEDGRVTVKWTEQGGRRQHSWIDGGDARALAAAFAQGTADRLAKLAAGHTVVAVAAPLTVRQLWQAYAAAEFDHLRPKSQLRYRERWDAFELFVGTTMRADAVTRAHLDGFKQALRRKGHVASQIARYLSTVRQVYRWGIDNDRVGGPHAPKVLTYRFKKAKEDKEITAGAFTPEEGRQLVAYFDPRNPRRWRAYVATYVLAFAGPRVRAALHLEWRDVDFAAGTLTWRPELDKQGKQRTQPVPPAVMEALWVAYGWRTAYGYPGPFVFFRPGAGALERDSRKARPFVRRAKAVRSAARADQPYTYGAYVTALHKAERACGITPQPYRGAHAFRRLVVGALRRATGDLIAAGRYVGDVDVRVLRRSYDHDDADELRHLAVLSERTLLGPAAGAPHTAETRKRNQNATDPAGVDGADSEGEA